jgi:hypothetical protein
MVMNLLGLVASGGVGELMKGVGSLAKDIRSAITGEISPEKKAELEQKLLELEFASQKAQTDINIEEAKHQSIFVAGWRPFIGWICGTALFYHFIGHPLLVWAVSIFKLSITPPVINTESLLSLVFALLGMGGLRTVEKIKSVQDKH